MENAKEFVGKNLDEAIKAACAFFDLPREKLEVEILNDARTGIFGLVGARKAKIIARQALVRDALKIQVGSRLGLKNLKRSTFEAGQGLSNNDKWQRRNKNNQQPDVGFIKSEKVEKTDRPDRVERFERIDRPDKFDKSDKTDFELSSGVAKVSKGNMEEQGSRQNKNLLGQRADPDSKSSFDKRARVYKSKRFEGTDKFKGQPDNYQRDVSAEFESQVDYAELKKNKYDGKKVHLHVKHKDSFASLVKHETSYFEQTQEGLPEIPIAELDSARLFSIAEGLLNKVLPLLCEQADFEVGIADGRLNVQISCEKNFGLLIGREGQTLAALQYILSRIIGKAMNAAVHVHIDAGEYRERQDEKLRKVVLYLAEKVKATGRHQVTRPLSSYHRRVVHLALQAEATIFTKSQGEGPMKRVVIALKY